MARRAALGREKLLARIQHVQEFLNYRRAQINHYLTWVANEEAKIPYDPAIKNGTKLNDDVNFLEKIVAFIKTRADTLRQKGLPLDDSWTLDAGTLLAQCTKPPRGTEMGHVVLKRAAGEVEVLLRDAMMQLHDIERNRVWNWVNHLLEVATGIVTREIDREFGVWILQKDEEKKLREVFEEALNPDAVWLKAKKQRLEDLRTKLEAAKWQKPMEEHERNVLELFEIADAIGGINVGQRQTLMTEYFQPAAQDDESA